MSENDIGIPMLLIAVMSLGFTYIIVDMAADRIIAHIDSKFPPKNEKEK